MKDKFGREWEMVTLKDKKKKKNNCLSYLKMIYLKVWNELRNYS